MSLIHWNYYLALEEDLEKLSRYIEINEDNLGTYSIETARILMLASQEVDVLLKQLCKKYGESADAESDYCKVFIEKCPQFSRIPIFLPRYDLRFTPFIEWKDKKTPVWWTANNKIKHSRDTEFRKASLENAMLAMAGLILTNIYYYLEVKDIKELHPNPRFLDPQTLVTSITPTRVGNLNNYKLPES
jgi:hypothetical protein